MLDIKHWTEIFGSVFYIRNSHFKEAVLFTKNLCEQTTLLSYSVTQIVDYINHYLSSVFCVYIPRRHDKRGLIDILYLAYSFLFAVPATPEQRL